jgi:translation initiation factor 3 subunit L
MGSWQNYVNFFKKLLEADEAVSVELPTQWLWDMIDEFVFQFQSFRQHVSRRYASMTDADKALLKANPSVWSVRGVMYYLSALVRKSRVVAVLECEKRAGNAEEMKEAQGVFGGRNVYRMLGYFAIVGLTRVHCLLGDYYEALKTLEPIQINRTKGLYTRVMACHVSLYYYLGFAYMMMRRYSDAIKTFSSILQFLVRSQGYQSRTYQFDQIEKKTDRMYALLAIAVALCPQRIDENVNLTLREKYSDKMYRMQRGDVATFEELFVFACPKFVLSSADQLEAADSAAAAAASASAATDATDAGDDALNAQAASSSSSSSPTDAVAATAAAGKLVLPSGAAPAAGAGAAAKKKPRVIHNAAVRLQLELFMGEVRQQILLPTIRSYLKLYTTIGLDKLSSFLDMDRQQLVELLLCIKHKTYAQRWQSGTPPLDGPFSASTDVRFFIDNDMVCIASGRGPRRYSDYYIRHINRLDDLVHELSRS